MLLVSLSENDYYYNLSPTLLNPSANVQPSDLYPAASRFPARRRRSSASTARIALQRFREQLYGPRLPLCSQRSRAHTLHMPSLHARFAQAGFLAIARTLQGPDLTPR